MIPVGLGNSLSPAKNSLSLDAVFPARDAQGKLLQTLRQ
jgi:hypothetical protein